MLPGTVPAVAGWSLANVPRGLSAGQVVSLLDSFDRDNALGIRDHAMVLFMARLGMQRIEMTLLSMKHIDWRSGTFAVTGKANQREQLPLLNEADEALRDYLLHARPRCDCQSVFITMRHPYRAISSGASGAVMGQGQHAGGNAKNWCPPAEVYRVDLNAECWIPDPVWPASAQCCTTRARCTPRSTPKRTLTVSRRWLALGRRRVREHDAVRYPG